MLLADAIFWDEHVNDRAGLNKKFPQKRFVGALVQIAHINCGVLVSLLLAHFVGSGGADGWRRSAKSEEGTGSRKFWYFLLFSNILINDH